MAVTRLKRKARRNKARAKVRNSGLSLSRRGSYSRPTEEQLKELGVAATVAAEAVVETSSASSEEE